MTRTWPGDQAISTTTTWPGAGTTVVIAAIATDHCGSTTARMSGNLGFETWVAGDACATFDREGPDGEVFPADLIHRTSLASLHDEFADVVSTDEAIAGLR
jgi:nicotinamidase-related amidase